MADLSAYIDFSIVLNKSVDPPVIKFIDPNHYPGGVAPTLTGIISITQPDGTTVSGNFTSPQVYWTGSALAQPIIELRLNTINQFQQGMYVVVYTIRATGYDETVLTKTFSLNYKQPVGAILKAFDLFTPSLKVLDGTDYSLNGFTWVDTIYNWSSVIRSVSGTDQTITSNTDVFDLAYSGNYYDSLYDVTMIANPQWTLDSASWVTLIDVITVANTFQAEIPPSIDDLRNSLEQMKFKDADGNICGKCKCSADDVTDYFMASVIYEQFIDRGKAQDLAGLSVYVLQMQKLFNNCVVPVYVNTNEIIPTYDFAGGAESIAWDNVTGKPSTIKLQLTVGAGGSNPANNASVITNAAFTGKTGALIQFWRGGIIQWEGDPVGDTYFTKVQADAFISIGGGNLTNGEKLIIYILPL